MGDAAGEPSHRLHFLRLPELLLQCAPLGHILGKQLERPLFVTIRNGAAGNANFRAQSVFPLPFCNQAGEGCGAAQVIGQFKPLIRIGIKSSQMLSHQVRGGGISQHIQE